MSLQEKLQDMREASAKRIPPDTLKVMHSATQQLRDSGIMDGVIKTGDPLPPFALLNAHGVEVSSTDLLNHGPLVLTVFRGHW